MLTVIVPAHNEAGRLEGNVRKIIEAVSGFSDVQVIIAEDGSTDGTLEEAARLAESDERVSLQHFSERLGRGLALKRACGLVKGDKVIYMDADLATDISHTEEAFRLLDRHDIVVGSRYADGSMAERSRKRMILGKAHSRLSRLIIPSIKVSDINCGFKGFRKAVFQDMCSKVKSKGWNWDIEMLARARKSGYSIAEMPVKWKESDRTTVRLFWDTVYEFSGILRARFA